MGAFTFVYIPHDMNQAVNENRLQFSPGEDIECFLDEVRSSLQAGPVRLVRTISLLVNSRANDYIGVNMYADGSPAKDNMPENGRAMDLCRLCGQTQAQIRGDAWMARILDDDDNFERLDFHVSDLEPSAPWIAMAAQQRIGRLRAPAQTILARIRAYCAEKEAALHVAQHGAQSRQRTAAEVAQEEADAAFKAHDHAAAAELFGKCADTAGPQEERLRLAALSRRALAYLKLRQPAAALADCDMVLAAQPGNTAVLYRKAAACRALGRRDDARTLLRQCVALQPGNKIACAALGKLEGLPARCRVAGGPGAL